MLVVVGRRSSKDMELCLNQPPEEDFCDLDSPRSSLVLQLCVMPSVFTAVLVLGLPLNLLSLWIFFQRLRRWTRSTVFLFNLTLADTSWLLALPLLVYYHQGHLRWGLGLPLCTAVRMLYHNYFYLSIFFVTCVSVDRYLAVVHPLRSLTLLGRRGTCLLCVAVWAAALLLSAPVAGMTLTQTCPGSNRTICTLYVLLSDTRASLPYSVACSVLGFLLPLLLVCYCGLRTVRRLRGRPGRADPSRRHRRLRRVLSAALVLFAFFYLPYHLSRNAAIAMRAFHPERPASWGPADLTFTLEMCLCSLITCINPLFSCFIGRQFRGEFQVMLAGILSLCPGLRGASVISKSTRMTERRRQGTSAVAPQGAASAPGSK